jgi:hypothetical protein
MKGLKLANPLILSGSDGINVFPDLIDNRANVTASVFTEQDITPNGNLTLRQTSLTDNSGVNVASSTWLIQKIGSNVKFIHTGSLSITGSLGANETVIKENLNITGKITAKEIASSNISASVIFQSGSTKFGDSGDDTHPFTGSLQLDGSLILSGSSKYKITDIKNNPRPSGSLDQTNPLTEFAGRSIIAPFSQNQIYNRKCFAKVATSLTSTTATFTAVTASAPRSNDATLFEQLPNTTENDFIFFKNGMIMEPDALTIQQNSDELVLTIDSSELGYQLIESDEIVAWGKFNS